MRRRLRNLLVTLVVVMVLGLLIPEHWQLPVQGADRRSYDQRSYWYYPWGKSVTHKGVDIFAKAGTPVNSATGGLVVYTGVMGRGGNVVLVLGPKWRLHYFAHLKDIHTSTGTWVSEGDAIGTVGDTGNAAGKPAHLHYTIMTLVPHPWKARQGPHGWRRMWYVDPTPLLNAAT